MTKMYRVAGSILLLATVAFGASSCMGPRYGTDKTATEQLFDDVADVASLSPTKKEKPAPYQPRGGLVKPANDKALVQPETNLASADNPQWLESPEQMRDRLRKEADDNANSPSYRSPLAVSVTEGKALSPEQQAKAFREARAIQDGRYSDRRRFMSDPPLEYRKVDDPTKLEDLGEPEKKKAERRKKEAEIAGSGKKWWQVWE